MWLLTLIACKFAHSKSYAFSKNLLYSDAVPSSGLNVQKRVLTQLECARLCGQEVTCQTFFYKPLGGVCSLYNHPLLEYTPVIFEEGVEIYTMKGCQFSDFTMYREGGICISIFSAENMTSLYASTACNHRGGELISLDTDGKIQFLKTYLLQYFKWTTPVLIGLDNSDGWKWSNNVSLTYSSLLQYQLNSYDAQMHPCPDNYCGVLRISPTESLLFDQCCSNIRPLSVCSMSTTL